MELEPERSSLSRDGLSHRGLVVIDGPNTAGKTTLATYLAEHYGARRVHCVYRFKDRMYTYHLAQLRRAIKLAEDSLVVLDRSWASELIYGAVYRGGTKWPQEGRLFQKLLNKHAAIQLFCLLDEEECEAQVARHRKEGYHSPEFVSNASKVRQTAALYNSLWHGDSNAWPMSQPSYGTDLVKLGGAQALPQFMRYRMGIEGADLGEFCKKLTSQLRLGMELQYPPALNAGVRNVAGHAALAKYLFVGDQVNHPRPERVWPFMGYQGSSLFLAEQLSALGVLEHEIAWTNLTGPEDHIHRLLEFNPGLKVIALGSAAGNWLSNLGLLDSMVSHPAHAMRFLRKGDQYLSSLETALS